MSTPLRLPCPAEPVAWPARTRATLVALVVLAVAVQTASADWQREGHAWSRVIKHNDGTRTHSKQDVNTRILEEATYNQGKVLVKRRLFQLDAAGQPRSGLIFDGKANLVARIQYRYDEYDDLKEELLFNTRGQLVRRLVYGLGTGGGIKSKPVAFTYDPSAPKASPVRSEEAAEPVLSLGVKTGAGSGIPAAKDAAAPPAAGSGQAGSPESQQPDKEKDKGGIFSRFRRKG